jgi:hypothetical protein
VQDLSCLKAITIEEVGEAVELSMSRNVLRARAEQNA